MSNEASLLADDASLRALFATLTRSERARAIELLPGRHVESLMPGWIPRPEQQAPAGDWRIWLLLAGRGFGKTRAGAEWIRERAETDKATRIALVAPTAADARDVMIEGESGLLAIAPDARRPRYEPSKRRLTWPNGAIATAYSAEEPDRLRGPQHDAAWCDELAVWRHDASWDMLMLGLRLGRDPRCVVTTTPKPGRLIRALVKDPTVAITRGATFDNADNLAPAFLDAIVKRYRGTRLGRQELLAELLEDVPGALWSRDAIERGSVAVAPVLTRIVVAIDPAASSGDGADETGIVVAGIDGSGHGYVLDDLSGRFAPHEWARRAVAAYKSHAADRIVAEVNNGGDMVEATLRVIDPNASYRAVHASRGKAVRAEPVAALYEQGRVHHVGRLPTLEDQMCEFTGASDRDGRASPDRVDALVWAITDLMIATGGTGILDYYRGLIQSQRGS
jgi:phage terminase large subunit-like protein